MEDFMFANNQNDEIEVESVQYGGFPTLENQHDYNNPESTNINTNFGFDNSTQVNWQNNNSDPFNSYQIDEEEAKRMEERRREEDERKSNLMRKMNDEIRIKQEHRDKARQYLENWRDNREKNMSKRREFNANNETEFLNNRKITKEGKSNPWEKVVENIEIRESDYKGTKDVARMRNVILTRKNDFTQLKMK